ncbi:MAG TPA: hypothetical protein VMU34_22950 [Mycobacterium sp.]|nr:hypothetical protein [Mycobacterium sp.]
MPGLDGFTGPVVHTARGRHDVDFADRRIAVIGTGASAVQVVPALAERAAHLSVCQRTTAWITTPIARVTSDAVITADEAAHRCDALVLATGFQASRHLSRLDVVGVGGRKLHDDWATGAHAYLGVACRDTRTSS